MTDIPPTHNFDDFTDTELTVLVQQVRAEQGKRARRAEAAKKADEARDDYRDTIDRRDGDPWVQPTSYLDTYDAGDTVTREDRLFTSNIDGNTLDPLVSGWTEQLPDGEYPVWKAPLGYQDAHQPGAIVWYPEKDTDLYRNDHDDLNAWEPGGPHSQWTLIEEYPEIEEPPVEDDEPIEDEEPEPVEPPDDDSESPEDPEPEPEPPIDDEPTEPEPEETYPVWEQPTGWETAYDPGAIVWYPEEDGQLYINTHTAGNSWEPTTPHSQWEPWDEATE